MTALARRKSKLSFETSDVHRYRGKLREIIVEANEYTATVRLKGTRQRYEISWCGVFDHAVKIHVERERAERKAKRAVR